MPRPSQQPLSMNLAQARRLWLRAQRLDEPTPFGSGPEATRAAVEHLGYVQIDTINVIERCHHHILFTRIPDYRRAHLHQAQDVDKTVFEYWTHALSYVPVRDFRFFVRAMKQDWDSRGWFASVQPKDMRKVLRLIREGGPLTIRDIDDDELREKDHPWASRKPSKRALQLAFFKGILTVSARSGMVKTYDLTTRHFGWERLPKAASEREVAEYVLDRALRAQGLVSLDSICHLDAGRKPAVRAVIERRVRRGELVPVALEGAGKQAHWARPEALEEVLPPLSGGVHILSPFDPLVIQRRRLQLFFGYEHRFEAYLPKEKRVFGYFGLPVLLGDGIVAVLDLKTDREKGRLLMQQWTWIAKGARMERKRLIEEALERFEAFQLGK
ncbi:MAG TPA: crosslink repair DNA glycosylase YcaQ family protein [Ferrovibrio sp.]|jgi:uncharacterized protein YcaQ|uniref:winged helix-turn-helix domain-containing protein n=1 Tax=Ferrovibrio sp. TaxID=1917215 RepID=UPI002B4AED36|nr:crosslink repair DNA glycosylase YcaQ family protein [Ferrovibrio sp.]HLT76645.1 crosslink repair DNA glycosylase YcaQ family protein [Ferrovibrio sp.]